MDFLLVYIHTYLTCACPLSDIMQYLFWSSFRLSGRALATKRAIKGRLVGAKRSCGGTGVGLNFDLTFQNVRRDKFLQN